MFEFPVSQVLVARVILGVVLAFVQRPAFAADLPIRLEMYMVFLRVVEYIGDRYHRKAMICIDVECARADKAVGAPEDGPGWGSPR